MKTNLSEMNLAYLYNTPTFTEVFLHKTVNKYEHVFYLKNNDFTNFDKITYWCSKNFIKSQYKIIDTGYRVSFYFIKNKDAMLFKLRWSEYLI